MTRFSDQKDSRPSARGATEKTTKDEKTGPKSRYVPLKAKKSVKKAALSGEAMPAKKALRAGLETRSGSEDVTYARIKAGMSGSDVERLIETGGLRRGDIELVIPRRTLARRLRGTLPMAEADALARMWRVREHAERTFEDRDLADQWLTSANPELGDERPIDMARTDVGAREVEAVLARLEQGIIG